MIVTLCKKYLLHLDFRHTFDGLHHFHLRTKKQVIFEDVARKFIDKSIYVVGVLFPLMTLPQVWEIYITQKAGGVSLFMWVFGMLAGFYWLLYGYLHNDYPIIVSQIIWACINVLMITGILLYR